jgi:hypothetical protein
MCVLINNHIFVLIAVDSNRFLTEEAAIDAVNFQRSWKIF